MLDDAQIDRWSRQILLPEIGGRGQAQLLAARVALVGDGTAAAVATDLLRRAGIGRIAADDEAPDVVVELDATPDAAATLALRAATHRVPLVRTRRTAGGGRVETLAGSPCGCCLPAAAFAPVAAVAEWLAPAVERALGALIAGEALVALTSPRGLGRRHDLDVVAGRFTATPLDATDGCARCRGAA